MLKQLDQAQGACFKPFMALWFDHWTQGLIIIDTLLLMHTIKQAL